MMKVLVTSASLLLIKVVAHFTQGNSWTCGGVSRDAPLDAVLKAPVSLFFVQECPSDGLHRIAMASNLIKLLVTSSDALATSSVHVTSSVALVTRCKAFKRARPLT